MRSMWGGGVAKVPASSWEGDAAPFPGECLSVNDDNNEMIKMTINVSVHYINNNINRIIVTCYN